MTDPHIDALLDEAIDLRRQVSELRTQIDQAHATITDLRSDNAALRHHLSPR